MAVLSVRDVDPSLLRALRIRAAERGTTVREVVLDALTGITGGSTQQPTSGKPEVTPEPRYEPR